ncbi:MAG: DUF748 domain-containing protein [Arcobacter sp.]|uniref:DUF748 domain-containing protein n=1 Tax=Arcobacter sp. TaxID=1872629 RepID=UPI003B005B16
MKNNLFIKILVSVFIIYSLLGFFLIPYIAKDQIIKNLDNLLIYKSDLKKVSFNPYTLSIRVDDFSISKKDKKIIAFDEIEVDFSLLKSIHESHISFKTLNIVKPYVNIVQDEDGNINLASILRPQEKKTEEKIEKNSTEKTDIPAFKISKTQIIDANFVFTQIFDSKKTTTNINNFNYTFYDIGTFKNYLASHNLVTNINEDTKLYLDGGFRLTPFKMYGKVKLENLKSNEYIGYTKDLLNFQIGDPTLSLSFGYRVDTTKELEVYIDNANLSLKNLKLIKDNKELASLSSFKINDLNLDLAKQKISTNDISLNSLLANIVSNKNEQLNVDNLINIKESTTSKKNEKTKSEKPWIVDLKSFTINNSSFIYDDIKSRTNIKANDINVLLDSFKLLDQKIKIEKSTLGTKSFKLNDKVNKTDITAQNIELNLNNLVKNEKGLKLSSVYMTNPIASIILGEKVKKEKKETKKVKKLSTSKDSGIALDIGPVKINNAKLTFQDKNLKVPFKTNITKLNGSFSELNSKSSKPTKLKLEGKIDKYGYTRITGFVDHKNIKNLTDVNLIFKNIAIKNFTPYSGKFAGRELEKGKLNLNLQYNISKSNIDAKNSVIITDIELGKKIESPDAVSLPLELGIALLEDSDGVIDIDLPITGNLDDPQFSIAPIIWKVFTNLIIKAVSSPFSFLASLLGIDAEEIKSVEFIYGESILIDSEKETLDNIAKAFAKRPNLALKVEPSYDINKDKSALQALKLESLLTLDMKKIKDGDKYLLALENRYIQSKEEISLKKVKEEFTSEVKGKKYFDKDSYIAKIKEILKAKIEVTVAQLEALSLKRVDSIKAYLLKKHSIDNKRLFINDKIKVLDEKNAKYAEFDLAIDIKKK